MRPGDSFYNFEASVPGWMNINEVTQAQKVQGEAHDRQVLQVRRRCTNVLCNGDCGGRGHGDNEGLDSVEPRHSLGHVYW